MDILTTATGRKYDCDYFNPSAETRQLNISIHGKTIGELSPVFADRNETASITCDGITAEGYTNLIAIFRAGPAVRVVLEKE